MNAQDPHGYYGELGLSPGASASQITEAYRRLAMQWHPDRNGDPSAKQRFQRVSEAYEVLGNADKRAKYDSTPSSTQQRDHKPIDPIVCVICDEVVAQPRYIIFRRVVSLILSTSRTPVQGIFCSKCAAKEGFRATAISAIAGWWGVPWGPIFTAEAIVRNALGGERPPGSEQRLLWYNALAFLSRGNAPLAYGLARRVQVLGDNELSAHASDLVSKMHGVGVPRDSPPLKNPWKLRIPNVAAHVAMLCFVPVVAVALVANAPNLTGGASPSSTLVASAGSGTAPEANAPPIQSAAPAAPQQPICADPPSSGEILAGQSPSAEHGHRMEIENGSDGPVIVKVRSAETGRLAFSFFIAQGQAATVKGITDGSYKLQWAVGSTVLEDCTSLGGVQAVYEDPDTETFKTIYTDAGTGTEIGTQVLSLTLQAVPNGNMQPQAISAAEFNAA